MNFICEKLSILDDRGFMCTVEFSDKKDLDNNENEGIEETTDNYQKYFRIQRSYPEELYENNFYSIETTESGTELGYLDKIIINLTRDLIKIEWCSDRVEIGLKLNKENFDRLRKILKTRFKEKIIMFEK
jgi:hypothetical protein